MCYRFRAYAVVVVWHAFWFRYRIIDLFRHLCCFHHFISLYSFTLNAFAPCFFWSMIHRLVSLVHIAYSILTSLQAWKGILLSLISNSLSFLSTSFYVWVKTHRRSFLKISFFMELRLLSCPSNIPWRHTVSTNSNIWRMKIHLIFSLRCQLFKQINYIFGRFEYIFFCAYAWLPVEVANGINSKRIHLGKRQVNGTVRIDIYCVSLFECV